MKKEIKRLEEKQNVRKMEIDNKIARLAYKVEEMQKKNEDTDKESMERTAKTKKTEEEKGYLEKTRNEVEKMKNDRGKGKTEEKKQCYYQRQFKQNGTEIIKNFFTEEFNSEDSFRKIVIGGRERREIAVIEMKDWETKQIIMKKKRNLKEEKCISTMIL